MYYLIGDFMLPGTSFKKQLTSNQKIVNILNSVPYDKGFHFFTAIGSYTGETAISLDVFAKKLQVASVDSIKFHFQRNDFQNWIKNTIGDDRLAERISQINRELPILELRKELVEIVQTRITELRNVLPDALQHNHS
jgi:hypothetical protein